MRDAACCAPELPADRVSTQPPMAGAAALIVRIEAMDCPTEEGLLRKALGAMDGVESLDFNLMQRRLTVHHRLSDTAPILAAITALDMVPIVEGTPATGSADTASVFRIENMDCPTEEALIRTRLTTMAEVVSMDFNLIRRTLSVTHAAGQRDAVTKALHDIGMQAILTSQLDANVSTDKASVPTPNKKRWALGVAAAAAVGAEAMAWTLGTDKSWPVIVLALIAICLSGTSTYRKGWIALKNFNLNINALMAIAVTGAVAIGQWPEAAMVMVLFALAEVIEAMSLDRARNAIRGLMEMTPEKATVQQPDGSWQPLEASAVAVGMIVRVGPGERVPLDGQLTVGQSSVNQAPITGESMPVIKAVGDKVFAGTINETGSFEYRVTAVQTESTLARIIRAVEDAQGSRAPTQRFVDGFAKVYTPVVFLLALGLAIVPPLAMGLPWMDWIYKALVLLVIACPCALVVSTPVTVVSGLAAAAKLGILIKGGVYLEEGRKLRSIALDKTGTITQGKPAVTDLVPLDGQQDVNFAMAAALAARSDHPVSMAINAHWTKAPQPATLATVDAFEAVTGCGVKGRIDGQLFYLANHRLIEELGICNASLEASLGTLEASGKTAVVLCSERAPLLIIAVADTIRETSREAIAELHQLGIRTLMLTGDNDLTAKAIAKSVGIDDARGDMLPEHKLEAINEELSQYTTVGMVGDGINDAPALAKASIGFAMGAAGTDTAIETADVALMDDDLRKLPQFIRLSRKTGRILKQNITIALGIKVVFLALAFMGTATLWMAVFADMGASLIVVFNGLRLMRTNGSRKPTALTVLPQPAN
jgi:Cd2+/Zn2+-exporting ATPase